MTTAGFPGALEAPEPERGPVRAEAQEELETATEVGAEEK
jgi:hypothetical protein